MEKEPRLSIRTWISRIIGVCPWRIVRKRYRRIIVICLRRNIKELPRIFIGISPCRIISTRHRRILVIWPR